jgi:hypothetical protein
MLHRSALHKALLKSAGILCRELRFPAPFYAPNRGTNQERKIMNRRFKVMELGASHGRSHASGAELRFRGHWLKRAGFHPGSTLTLTNPEPGTHKRCMVKLAGRTEREPDRRLRVLQDRPQKAHRRQAGRVPHRGQDQCRTGQTQDRRRQAVDRRQSPTCQKVTDRRTRALLPLQERPILRPLPAPAPRI